MVILVSLKYLCQKRIKKKQLLLALLVPLLIDICLLVYVMHLLPFDCSMLYYLLFWTLLGFIMHFYIIFGTNLLTGGPTQNCCFFAYFRVSKKRNIKRSPNGMKPSGTWFSHRTWSRRLGPYVKKQRRRPRGRGAPSTLVAPLLLHRRTPSSYIYLHTPKRSETKPKT